MKEGRSRRKELVIRGGGGWMDGEGKKTIEDGGVKFHEQEHMQG